MEDILKKSFYYFINDRIYLKVDNDKRNLTKYAGHMDDNITLVRIQVYKIFFNLLL